MSLDEYSEPDAHESLCEEDERLWQLRITRTAEAIGVPDNRALAEYLIHLEERLADIDRSVDRLAEWTQRVR